jgi:hypothetical protein
MGRIQSAEFGQQFDQRQHLFGRRAECGAVGQAGAQAERAILNESNGAIKKPRAVTVRGFVYSCRKSRRSNKYVNAAALAVLRLLLCLLLSALHFLRSTLFLFFDAPGCLLLFHLGFGLRLSLLILNFLLPIYCRTAAHTGNAHQTPPYSAQSCAKDSTKSEANKLLDSNTSHAELRRRKHHYMF